jgi:murein L,D-transpeptidase YafK
MKIELIRLANELAAYVRQTSVCRFNRTPMIDKLKFVVQPRLLTLILFGLVLIASQVSSAERTAKIANPSANSTPSQPIAQRQPLQLPLRQPKIVIKKSQRQLLLFSADKLVRTYRIGLGLSPAGDKVRQGDRRTPEGEFYIFTKNDQSAFYLSLGISYPNAAHAERGLRDGLITKAQYESIMRALRAKKTPPQNTRLGGDIYIHGNGAQSDWTWGCAALENADMLELFKAVPVGTPVTIEP